MRILTSFYLTGVPSSESFATGVGVDPSESESYNLSLVRDTVAIAGFSTTDANFSLITGESSGFFDAPFDGIVGKYYLKSSQWSVRSSNREFLYSPL